MNKSIDVKDHCSIKGKQVPAMRGKEVSKAIKRILENKGEIHFKENGERLIVHNGEKNISISVGKRYIQPKDIKRLIADIGISIDELLENI